jgi:Cu/Ag efflux protein CusF
MRAWRVVVLVNLALALGVGGGYVWWGREARRLERELAAVRETAATAEREYMVDGIIRAVLSELGVIVVSHGEVPGYMPAMTMGFRTAAPNIQDTIEVGDAVRFTLRGTPPNMVIMAIEKKAP